MVAVAVYRQSSYIARHIIVGAVRTAVVGSGGGGGGCTVPNPGETGLAPGPSGAPRSSVDSSAAAAAVDGMFGCVVSVAPGVCGGIFDEEFDPATFPMNQLGSQPRSPFASLTA